MALTNCKDCGTEHSTNAWACPKCGCRYGRRSTQQIKMGCMVIAALLGGLFILGLIFG